MCGLPRSVAFTTSSSDTCISGVTSHRLRQQCRGGPGAQNAKGAQSDPNYVSGLILGISQNHHSCLLTLPFVANVCRGPKNYSYTTDVHRSIIRHKLDAFQKMHRYNAAGHQTFIRILSTGAVVVTLVSGLSSNVGLKASFSVWTLQVKFRYLLFWRSDFYNEESLQN